MEWPCDKKHFYREIVIGICVQLCTVCMCSVLHSCSVVIGIKMTLGFGETMQKNTHKIELR